MRNNNNNKNKNNKNSNRAERKPRIDYPRCETCGETNNYTERFYDRANAKTGHFPARANRKDRVDIINRTQRTV